MAGSEGPRGRVVVAFGAKPGVGTSTLTANLAVVLRYTRAPSVILVEAHHALGDLASILDLTPSRHLDQALAEGLAAALLPHSSGVQVLLRSPEDTVPTSEQMRAVLAQARDRAAFTLLDAPARFDADLQVLLKEADCALMITTPERTSLRHAEWLFEQAATWGVAERVYVVINRWASESAVESAQLDAALGDRVLGRVPSSGRVMLEATQAGRLIVDHAPDHAVSKALRELAAALPASDGA